MWFGLTIGFTGLLQLLTASNSNIPWIYKVYNWLQDTLYVFSVSCLHNSTGKCFQWLTPLLWVPELPPWLSHRSSQLTPQQLVHSRQDSLQSSAPIKKAVSLQTEPVKVKVTLRLTVTQSYVLVSSPNLGHLTRVFFSVTVLSFWGALSDERSGVSCVSLCHWSLL
jgi:hypothetical protein